MEYYGGSSLLAVMIADWKLPKGVDTGQVSGQHIYLSDYAKAD